MAEQGVRLAWDELPDHVRQAIDEIAGAPVRTAENQAGGFSPGVAARCELTDGGRVFVKAVSSIQNPKSPEFHRREIAAHRCLPADGRVPRLIGSRDDGEWVVLVLEDVEGEHPLPWSIDDLEETFATLDGLIVATRPELIADLPDLVDRLDPEFSFWRRLLAGEGTQGLAEQVDPFWMDRLGDLVALEVLWPPAARGDELVHADLRADNIIRRPDGSMVVVDWPGASRGAAWVDKLFMLPSVALNGGPTPEDVILELDPFPGVDDGALDAVLAALTGFLVVGGVQPDPPGLPTVREFQRAQGEQAGAWLARRQGWT